MPTTIIGISDSHYRDKTPRARKDDFFQTQLDKLDFVIDLSEKLNAKAIVFAGDVFDVPDGTKINRRLDNELAQRLRSVKAKILAIPGNHDLLRDRLDSLKYHPLGVLNSSGILQLLKNGEGYSILDGDVPVRVIGIQYTGEGPKFWLDKFIRTKELYEWKKITEQKMGKKAHILTLTHNHWGPADTTIAGEPVIAHHRIRNTGIDVLLYGHPHSDDGVTEVINPEPHHIDEGPW